MSKIAPKVLFEYIVRGENSSECARAKFICFLVIAPSACSRRVFENIFYRRKIPLKTMCIIVPMNHHCMLGFQGFQRTSNLPMPDIYHICSFSQSINCSLKASTVESKMSTSGPMFWFLLCSFSNCFSSVVSCVLTRCSNSINDSKLSCIVLIPFLPAQRLG